MSKEIHGPQGQWKKEAEKINERAARGPLKNWTVKQRQAYALELVEVQAANHMNATYADVSQALQVGGQHLTSLPSPFEGYANLEEALLDVQRQTEELMQDYRTLRRYCLDYKKGDSEQCPSPAAKSTTDPWSIFQGIAMVTPS